MAELTPAPSGYPLKIIRDKTTDIIGAKGELRYANVSIEPDNLKPWLMRKLGEEVTEYMIEPQEDELFDILAVVLGLGVLHGYDAHELLRAAESDPRGGFYTGRMMLGYHPEFDGSES